MSDQEYEGTEGEAQEMGATVQQPSYYVYKFACSECGTAGAEWNTEGEAQNEGHSHQATQHPPAPTYTVQQVGKY